MTRLSLLMRNLRYFRSANMAVILGMAVATAVLAGALMVGDSVNASLRDLAIQRLGPVDYALAGNRVFHQALADRIRADARFVSHFNACVAGISVRGSAASGNRGRTAGVQIMAIEGDWLPVPMGMSIINGELSDSIQALANSELALTVPSLEDVSRDATLARRERSETFGNLMARVQAVRREPGMASMFNFSGGQRLPRNAWVNLPALQDAVNQPGGANLLLVQAKPGVPDPQADVKLLNDLVKDHADLSDYGLSLEPAGIGGEKALTCRSTYLPSPVETAAAAAAKAADVPLRPVAAYLVNTAANLSANAENPTVIHYATAAGIGSLEDNKPIANDEIVLNEWAASHLRAKPGDRIRLDYYYRQSNGELVETRSDRAAGLVFRVGRIVPMAGLGADRALTPAFKGLTDADAVSDWDAPRGVEIKKSWITKDDEAYWKRYRAAPKLFVSLDTARKLWGGAYGSVTSIRLPAEKSEPFLEAFRKLIDPASLGMSFRAIKAEQLAASSGSTDFAMLFVAFSFFLIVAALLLTAMLFGLGIEQRRRQIGLMAAIGFSAKGLRRLALAEGLLLATIGAALGLFAAAGYTWLMVEGLRTWWVNAVGTTYLRLHVRPLTLVYGFLASVIMAMLAIAITVRRVAKSTPASLIAGKPDRSELTRRRRGRTARAIGVTLIAVAIALLLLGMFGAASAQEAFLGGGALLLAGSLCWLGGHLRPHRVSALAMRVSFVSVGGLGVRNASRHTGRSTLTIGLIAFATFTLVTVAAMRQPPQDDVHRRDSGAGGYDLILQADIPLLGNLATRQGRDLLGVRQADPVEWPPLQQALDVTRRGAMLTARASAALETMASFVRDAADAPWTRSTFTCMRSWAGQDISCLNLTRPGSPTILAVGDDLVRRNAFSFARTIRKVDNPWTLLEGSADDQGGIPVIADDETAEYILHLGLGDALDLRDQTGTQRRLVLVATLHTSIFQSEMLMGESNFLKLFPSQSGFGVVLVDSFGGRTQEMRRLLTAELEDYSVTVDPTIQRLAAFKNVQNTYLSTFQTLGSLGLMLGTIGLAVVLVRGLIERRAELAMLASLGFSLVSRMRLVLAENAFLLLLGLSVGAACAVIAVTPALIASARPVQLIALAGTLLGIFGLGLLVLVLTVYVRGKHISPGDLNRE